MVDLNIFSKRLKEAREAKGYTQKTLAVKVGVTPASLSAYEKEGKNPSLSVAAELAKECGVSLDWLCGIEGETKAKIKKYSDLIKILLPLAEENIPEKVITDDKIQLYDMDGYGYQCYVGLIAFKDPEIVTFFSDWSKMLSLLEKGSIDKEVYNLWIEKTLNKYNFNIEPSK